MRVHHRTAAAFGLLLAGFTIPAFAFQVEEASIESIQSAIQSGETTCQQVVQAYIDRAKAYNGVCTALVTKDGKPVEAKPGVVRAGSPLKFPTATVAVNKILPNLDKYKGLPSNTEGSRPPRPIPASCSRPVWS